MMDQEQRFMEKALELARRAAVMDEVPIGAVVVYQHEVVAAAHNLVECRKDATAHAELLALSEAGSRLQRWRLTEADIYVTLEPCPMCASALALARVRHVYFAAPDPRMGACGSVFDLCSHAALGGHSRSYGGLLEDEAKQLLQNFFQAKRRDP